MVAVEFASVKEPVGQGSGWIWRGRPPDPPPLRFFQFRHFRRSARVLRSGRGEAESVESQGSGRVQP